MKENMPNLKSVCQNTPKHNFKSQKVKKETEFNSLFRSYVALNDDALRAYKAMIEASYNSSQTHRQVKCLK